MRILIAVLTIIIVSAFGPIAQSCECGDTRAATCFKDASVIFEGEVLSMQIRTHALFEGMTLAKQTTTEYTVFTLRVGRVYKGAPPKIIIDVDDVGSKSRTIRIANVICPHKGQTQLEEARRLTEKLLLGKTITFLLLQNESTDAPLEYEDSPGMRVGLPTEAAHTTVAELIKAGFAWHCQKYSADPELTRPEAEARKAQREIWSVSPSPPKNQSNLQSIQ